MVDLRVPNQGDLADLIALDYRNFGHVAPPDAVERTAALLDLDRFLIAVDGEDLVAAGGSYKMELTLPGLSTIPVSGVTWVSVAATHRRQGILRRLMAGFDELAVDLEEPVLCLTASEGGIYERFGYGVSIRNRVTELDRRRAQIAEQWQPEPGSVRLIDGIDHVDQMLALYDRYRVTQVGEVSRSEALFRDLAFPTATSRPFGAIHADGYALWKIEQHWNEGHPAHHLSIVDLVAATPQAHAALWHTVLSVDLVGPISSYITVAHDDPLPYLLTDQRALRTVEANDFLWLKVADPVAAFSARTYRTNDELVLGITEEVEDLTASRPKITSTISVGANGAKETDQEPDLCLCRSALGPLLLGGVTAGQLAAGRRIIATKDTLDRADALLGTGRLPHCRTSF